MTEESLTIWLIIGAAAATAAASAAVFAVVRRRRRRPGAEGPERLAAELERARTACVIARQIESLPRFEALLRRVADIAAEALGAERCRITLSADGWEREAFESGRPCLRDGRMAVPLKTPRGTLGVMVADGRPGVGFGQGDLDRFAWMADCAAGLIEASAAYRKALIERDHAGRLAKALVGRELKMRELKERLRGREV